MQEIRTQIPEPSGKARVPEGKSDKCWVLLSVSKWENFWDSVSLPITASETWNTHQRVYVSTEAYRKQHAHVPLTELDKWTKLSEKARGITELRKRIFLCFLFFPTSRGWDPVHLLGARVDMTSCSGTATPP